ncbi:MAG TPA: YjjG family noncanonical pyrimidine nucleotidase [Cytophagaceae bacterium]|nr:YjjG family noncanonical pyrimidine nucleotidase [Cytophagaceae bacterium]
MPVYKHILFDLDHTLWDFDKNCAETLNELYALHNMSRFGFDTSQFFNEYKTINVRMWKEFNAGRITKEAIRASRFELTFNALGLNDELVPPELNEQFMNICPAKSNVLPHTHHVLEYLLNKKYMLHILTNGFSEIQQLKINSSNLGNYFCEIINSESCGYLKPDKKIFDYTLNKINASNKECIMIGDDLEADIVGARNAGIDHIFFNPNKDLHKEEVTHEITCLSELLNIL